MGSDEWMSKEIAELLLFNDDDSIIRANLHNMGIISLKEDSCCDHCLGPISTGIIWSDIIDAIQTDAPWWWSRKRGIENGKIRRDSSLRQKFHNRRNG